MSSNAPRPKAAGKAVPRAGKVSQNANAPKAPRQAKAGSPKKKPYGSKRPTALDAAGTPLPAAPPKPRHKAKRHLGQNFLHDRSVIEQIVEAAGIGPEDQVLEIGPGRGVLTNELAAVAGKLVAIEIDRSLAPFLEPLEVERSNLTVVYQDFMKADWTQLPFDLARPIKVVANIPYYITTPILMKLLQAERIEREPLAGIAPLAERILLMVQWEVAKRLTASPGNKDYGSLSLIAQYATEATIVTKVPATAFRPRPAVDSAVVMLVPRRVAPIAVNDVKRLFQIMRGVFQQRRKTLQNGLLAAGFPREQLETASNTLGLDMGRRAETLSLQEFAHLANCLGDLASDPTP